MGVGDDGGSLLRACRADPSTSGRAPPKKKRKKAAGKSAPRKQAQVELRALDGLLRKRLDRGLEFFLPGESPAGYDSVPPVLVLHTDEASTNISLLSWLQWSLKARTLFCRDPYRRPWNDSKLALQDCGQYWAVLLARVAFNLPYGLWDGQAWWGKLIQQAEDAAKVLPVEGPIWQEFYPRVCRDRGWPVKDELAHRKWALEETMQLTSRAKGSRMALNRWFGYLACLPDHLPEMNTRLLLILLIGMRLNVYRDRQEFPLLGRSCSGSHPARRRRSSRRGGGASRRSCSRARGTRTGWRSRPRESRRRGPCASGRAGRQGASQGAQEHSVPVSGHHVPRGFVEFAEAALCLLRASLLSAQRRGSGCARASRCPLLLPPASPGFYKKLPEPTCQVRD